MPDLTLLTGGDVIDGTGAPAVVSDVLIDGDRIAAVGPDVDPGGAGVIDVSGLTITPGFIDTHTHDDIAALLHPEMAFKVMGGVTSCVVGNCGLGAAPHEAARVQWKSFHPDADPPQWDGYGGYMAALEDSPPSVNIAVLMGHGTIRAASMGGVAERAPSDAETGRMLATIEEGMEAGAVGMSTGLIYPPGLYADTDELVELSTAVAAAGGIYTSHIRNEGDGLLDAITEAIEIGRRSGAPVVVSHLKANGAANWGRVSDALRLIDEARDAGMSVAADQYPYTAGSTVLSALVVQDAFGGGTGGLGRIDPAGVVIATSPDNPDHTGRTLAEVADEWESTPADVAARLVAGDPRINVVIHSMSEDDVQTVLATDGVMIGSDGLPTLEGKPHPRLYGTFARVLGHYARDLGVLGFEEAVHRMTGRSAQVFGLTDRGVIAPGSIADLVVFDRDTIIDVGTFDDPHHHPAGIHHVMVGGIAVVSEGRHTGARPGTVLRRSP